MTDQPKDPQLQEEQRPRLEELGAAESGGIYTLTIIGQVEGHQLLPETCKTTKYEHVLHLLASIEEDPAIAEMIAGMRKPTVSLVLGGGHSIGIPLAVSARRCMIAPTASMTIHPVRMTGVVVGAPQTYQYFNRIQEQIVDFVTANSRISREKFLHYMMATGEIATDVGSVIYGREAVRVGLVDQLGSVGDALAYLHNEINAAK